MIQPPHTLVLFDIDGTLVDCGPASGKSFSGAFHEAFGVPCPIFSPEEVAGCTDAAILMDVIHRLNLPEYEDFDQRRSRAFEIYARRLEQELTRVAARELPGAANAVRAVRKLAGCAVGLLTGSTQQTARIKLESAGIDFKQFVCGAYSEDGELREALPDAARKRFAELFGHEPDRTMIIGDTPRDVQAALLTGCDFIGVATGHYDRASLKKAGAEIILNDLTELDALRKAIETFSPKDRKPHG
jgi:phosphoglycolate phosphatase-like HAD superfamily hydrolase